MQYKTKSGRVFSFDKGRSWEDYNIEANSRVMTPKGAATVIGVYNNNLWFHIEGDSGATYWDNLKSFDDFINLGFCYIDDPESNGGDNMHITISNSKHSFSHDMKALYQQDIFKDLSILVGSVPMEFRAHRNILWARSLFFRALFSSNMKDSSQGTLRLPQISHEIFPQVLSYIYTGETTTNDIAGLYEAACFLQIESLQQDILLELPKMLCLTNAFPLLDLAYFHSLNHLKAEVEKYVERHAYLLLKNEKYLVHLPKEIFIRLLKSDNLIRVTEMDLFNAILTWKSKHWEEDVNVAEFLKHIRFERMSKSELQEVETTKLLSQSEIDKYSAKIAKESVNVNNNVSMFRLRPRLVYDD